MYVVIRSGGEVEAEADIWQQVADMAAAWHGQEVMTAEEYQRRQAEEVNDD